ncbi:unnamed protein product [Arctogadus glacialis]
MLLHRLYLTVDYPVLFIGVVAQGPPPATSPEHGATCNPAVTTYIRAPHTTTLLWIPHLPPCGGQDRPSLAFWPCLHLNDTTRSRLAAAGIHSEPQVRFRLRTFTRIVFKRSLLHHKCLRKTSITTRTLLGLFESFLLVVQVGLRGETRRYAPDTTEMLRQRGVERVASQFNPGRTHNRRNTLRVTKEAVKKKES